MPFISPQEIVAKAKNVYPRFLAEWIRGADADFFPYRIPANLDRDVQNVSATITASENLWSKSKGERGWGYTVHRETIRSRDFGTNQFPKAITIDTRDDLLRLAKKTKDFAATQVVVERVRSELPRLDEWLTKNVRTLPRYAEPIEGLIDVARFFMNNPWPDCYARQIPVAVDTKFIERNKSVLHQWLDLLLPDSAIDVNESTFARRFGLRDGQPHRGVRILDEQLAEDLGLPFPELSLPIRSIATLPVRDATVVIMENDLNLFTMPPFPRGIGLRGDGKAVTRLEPIKWLQTNRVLYWGDIDIDGFLILASLRRLVPHLESIMMDRATFEQHRSLAGKGNGSSPPLPANLTPAEADVYAACAEGNLRLEQEKIPQPYVDAMFARLSCQR